MRFNVLERREYEPCGLQLAPALADGPGYTGHVQDAATGLVYMQQRYYDPMLGIFYSVDPVTAYEEPVTNFCRYCYARNNPYLFTDPDGRDGSPFSMARADARIRELEASDPKAARTAQIQGYSAATWILFGPLVAWKIGMAALANPGAVATATELAAGAAGVTGTAGVWSALAGRTTDWSSRRQFTHSYLRRWYSRSKCDVQATHKGGEVVQGSTYPGALVRVGENALVGLRETSTRGSKPPTIDLMGDSWKGLAGC